MTKPFWKCFWQSFFKTSKYAIPLTAVFCLGLYLGNISHPYELCKMKYETPEDISECMWILEHD